MENEKSLQVTYAPESICFGCGPANEKGLRIESFPHGDAYICDWKPSKHHEAFPGILNGGIIGSLLDCHSNWAAAHHLMIKGGGKLPATVTADYSVRMKRPTPMDKGEIHLMASVLESTRDRATVEAELEADGKICAKCTGTFVAVNPGHPAYHRW
ncbi:MAG: thioesterase [Candidatus Marinimicrobia bacterium]|nr:thioesterase [Candidatus Neomarinimicrobiota bacterium]|tara:strand:+ start:1577 stop:2044 length:468 start_codon:yes stop_codon:yes gene_type:complete